MKTTALIIIGAFVLLIALLLMLRTSLVLAYKDDFKVYFKVLFVKIPIYPKKKRTHKRRSMTKKQSLKLRQRLEKEAKKNEPTKKQGASESKGIMSGITKSIDNILALVSAIIPKFLGHLQIKVARFKIIVATDDPAATAIAYGAVSQTVYVLEDVLLRTRQDKVKGLKSADVSVGCDFLSDTPTADIKLELSMRLWQALHVFFFAIKKIVETKMEKIEKENKKAKNKARKKAKSSK